MSTRTSYILLHGFSEILFPSWTVSPSHLAAACSAASHGAMMIPVRSHRGWAFVWCWSVAIGT